MSCAGKLENGSVEMHDGVDFDYILVNEIDMEEKKNGGLENAEQEREGKMSGVDLDRILAEELGQFGAYQARMLALAGVIVVFVAWSASEYVFTTARIATRCFIPECEVEGEPSTFAPPWLAAAVPPAGAGFDNCHRFAPNETAAPAPAPAPAGDSCPATLFAPGATVPCERYVYQNTDTVVYDFGLACLEWRRALIGSVRILGTLLALPLVGYVSDRWGRRLAIALSVFNTAWIGVVRYWAGTYIGFMLSELAEATFGSGGFSCIYILLMELVGSKYRVMVGVTMNTFFALGQVTMGLIAWGVPNWRLLTLTLYVPQLLTIGYYWITMESVRWSMSKGRYTEAENVLKRVAKINGKQLSDKSLQLLKENAEEEREKKLLEKSEKVTEPWLIALVFKHKRILLRCAVSPVWWITTTLIYYGLSINSVNLSGNRYLNYIAVCAIEIPGYWVAFFLMDKIGRKFVLIAAYWVCAACQIGYIFMPEDLFWAALFLYLVGKFSIAMVGSTIYVYTNELYPTKYRHSLFGFSSMMGRIGSIVAPLTPALGAALWEQLPFALFAGFALVSGALVLLTPETLGSRLPDSMEQAADIGRNKQLTNNH